MKKIWILSIIILSMASGCSKDLELKPISSATTVTFFTSTNDFLQSINAVYNSLAHGVPVSSPFVTPGYPDRQLGLSETRSDNLYATADGTRDWEPINDFSKNISSSAYVEEAWNGNFNGIFRANILLDNLTTKGNVISPASLKTRIEAEAKFLRAFYYFDLVRFFGKVPLATHALSDTEASSLPLSSVSDVYKQIISDLTFAADNLPESYAVADKGRATKYAAKGILALVYMTRSGSTYGIEGPGLGLNEWNLAVPLLNEILASPNYAFGSSYSNIFSYTNENNPEVIFDVQYISGQNPILGASFPMMTTPATYMQSLGKTGGHYGIKPVSTGLLNSYELGDTRKSFCFQQGYIYNNVPESQSFIKKYLDISKIPSNASDYPINFIVLRYTDILLLKAECVLHGASGSQVTDVDGPVNKVRQRAGLGTITNVTLDQLLNERRKEFVGEGSRWHDLVRFGKVESTMTSWIASEDVLHQIQPFNVNYIIYPIPQAELDAKPGLYTQNKGY